MGVQVQRTICVFCNEYLESLEVCYNFTIQVNHVNA